MLIIINNYVDILFFNLESYKLLYLGLQTKIKQSCEFHTSVTSIMLIHETDGNNMID